jgi:hypothetical protein
MPALSTWNLDPTRLLTRRELATILADLGAKADRFANVHRNLIIVRRACCCATRLGDRRVAAGRRGRGRAAPASAAAQADHQGEEGAVRAAVVGRGNAGGPCGVEAAAHEGWRSRHGPVRLLGAGQSAGMALQRAALRRRFLSACKALGLPRLRTLTIHHGRHTFISHALAFGRILAEVRAAAGHASLLTTSVYLHVAVDDDGEVGRLFQFSYLPVLKPKDQTTTTPDIRSGRFLFASCWIR